MTRARRLGSSWFGNAAPTREVRRGETGARRLGRGLRLESLEERRLLAVQPLGNEFRVNTTPAFDQRFWEPTPEATAMDADGDFVVTWSSQAQDGDGWGVFAQRFRADGSAAGGEFQVNSLAAANQQYSTVSMDPDGDFVITWSTLANEVDNLGVFARRYNAAGVPQGEEFRVSPDNPAFQRLSVSALDGDGNLVVAWSELDPAGGDDAASNVRARLFNADGVALGPAFQVNSTTGDLQRQASVARNERGQFVVVWRSREQDGDTDGVFARVYAADGTPLTGELQINQSTTGQQIRATVAMAPSGEFVVTWYNQLIGDSGGAIVPREVYARRFAADGTPLGDEFRVNTTTAGDQRFPSIAMNQAGDFVVAWASFQQDTSDWGIYAQAFDAAGTKVGDEFRVNSTVTNRQIYPAVAMDDEGDFVVAWQSLAQDGSGYGIYAQRFTQPLGSSFPVATGVYAPEDEHAIAEGERLLQTPPQLIVAFSEAMQTGAGADSVVNKANWSLTRNGAPSNEQIASITFAYNAAANRYEAKLTMFAPLTEGEYTLIALPSMRDVLGFGLDGDWNGEPGGAYSRAFRIAQPQPAGSEFRVNTTTAGDQFFAPSAPGTVAVDDAGNFIVTWTSVGQDESGQGVYARRYFANGQANGGEFQVSTFTAGDQRLPSVAVDPRGGNFVIAWTSALQDGSGDGVYAQLYAADGTKLGGEFRVNTTTANAQARSSVSMDREGAFVVAWESIGQEGPGPGIYFQRFAADGAKLGPETRANTFTTDSQRLPQVAVDADGDFVITWSSNLQDGDGYGAYARRFTAAGVALGGEFRVNDVTAGKQMSSSVALDDDGDFAIAWESENVDGSSDAVMLQLYDANGTPRGANRRANNTTTSAQRNPSVAIDDDGDITVAWQSLLQDGSSWGVYGQRFAWNVTARAEEMQFNVTTASGQFNANVGVDADGDFIVAWTSQSQDGSGQGIYARRYQAFVNSPPEAIAGTYQISEGDALQLNGAQSSDPDGQALTYSWDVNNDGVFGDAEGIAPALSWLQLNALGIVDDGAREIRLRVTDTMRASSEDVGALLVVDTAPSNVAHDPPFAVDEGGVQTITGSFVDPGVSDAHQAIVDWGDGTIETIDLALGARTFALTHRYADDNPTGTQSDQYNVSIRIAGDGATSAPDSTSFPVRNVRPQITSVDLSSNIIIEGDTLTVTGTFSDPGLLDTHTILVSWGDGTASFGQVNEAQRTFSASHVYRDEEPISQPILFLELRDDDVGIDGRDLGPGALTLQNSVPQVTGLEFSAGSVFEGGTVTLTGTFSDAGLLDTHTVLVSWGDGTASVATVNEAGDRFTATHVYADDNPTGTAVDILPVNVTLADDDNGVSSAQTSITVLNDAPTNLVIDPLEAFVEGSEVTLTGRFEDAGAGDTHSVRVDWGDGLIEEFPLEDRARSFAVKHRYLDDNAANSYTVDVRVTDDDGGTILATRSIAISNAPPELLDLQVTPSAIDEGGEVTLTGSIEDLGPLDTQTVLINWGDGTTSQAGVDQGVIMAIPVERNDPATPVLLFELEANGAATSLPSIPADETTRLSDPLGAVFSASGELFVSNRHGNNDVGSISRFRLLADGSFAFRGTITGNGLAGVHDLAFSPSGELFAANRSSGVISRFLFDEAGNALANGTISTGVGPNRLLGLAFSADGELFANTYDAIHRYVFGGGGEASAVGVFSIPGENGLQFVEFGPNNELFVPTDRGSEGRIYRYRLADDRTLVANGVIFIPGGSAAGVAFTPNGEMFVTSATGAMQRFLFDADGEATPNGTLPYTGLGAPAIFDLRTFQATHRYRDDNPSGTPADDYAISVTVTDDDGGEDVAGSVVTVANVAPAVAITDLPDEVHAGTPLTLQALAGDPGALDTFSFQWLVTRNGATVATGSGESFSFTPTETGAYQFALTGTDDDGGVGTAEIELIAEGCQTPGDTNGDCAVDLVDLNNVRNHFGETGLGVVDLSFNSPVVGSITDKDGLGVGFTHRLPGTGAALPANDPNLDLEPGVDGRLRIRSTQADLHGGVNLPMLEAPGVLQTEIGDADLDISTSLRNVQVPAGSDQLMIYVGVSATQVVRAGLHAGGYYAITSNTAGQDSNAFVSAPNAFEQGDNVVLTFSRRNGLWTLRWQNLTNGARSGESPQISVSTLDGESTLTIGVLYARPTSAEALVATLDSFAIDVRRPILGDTNGDYLVDLSDLNAVRNNFGTSTGAPAPPSIVSAPSHARAADAVFALLAAAGTGLGDVEASWFTPRRAGRPRR